MEEKTSEEEVATLRPEDTPLKQQKLEMWEPVLEDAHVVCGLMILGAFFFVLGVIVDSSEVQEFSVRYDNAPGCDFETNSTNIKHGQQCSVKMPITEAVSCTKDSPCYVYYELDNVYQNHRAYIRSYSSYQLSGVDPEYITGCAPLDKYGGKGIYPCGLVPNAMFNDRISAKVLGSNGIEKVKFCRDPAKQDPDSDNCVDKNMWSWQKEPNWSKQDIATKADIAEKFKYEPKWASRGLTRVGPLQAEQQKNARESFPAIYGDLILTLPRVDDQDLMVWMQVAALRRFRKLYRIIKDNEFKKGDIMEFHINNFFRVKDFKGKKSLVLSTTSWLGGNNHGLASMCYSVGTVCLSLFVIFLGLWWTHAPASAKELIENRARKDQWANYKEKSNPWASQE